MALCDDIYGLSLVFCNQSYLAVRHFQVVFAYNVCVSHQSEKYGL